MMAGVGRSTDINASPIIAMDLANLGAIQKVSRLVSRYDAVRKSCVAATRISPFLGVHRLLCTLMRLMASARASSVCGQ